MAFFDKYEEMWKDDPEYHLMAVIFNLTDSIYEAMEEQKLNRNDLVDKTKIERSTIDQLLTGTQIISLLELVKIAIALNKKVQIRLVNHEEE